MMFKTRATRTISHKKQDIFGVDSGLWLSNVMQRLGPIRKRRNCRLTLSPRPHDIIKIVVDTRFSCRRLAQRRELQTEDSLSGSLNIDTRSSPNHQRQTQRTICAVQTQ
jgi:hypothetical protein